MWILWAATCSTLHAASSACTKHIVERSPLLASTFLSIAFGLPLYLLLLAATGVPPIRPGFLPALAGAVAFNLATIPLRNLALRLSPLSLTMPFLAFTPLFLLVTESLLLGDRPGPRGLVGVVLIVLGAYALQLGAGTGPLGPLRAIVRERGSILMLSVAALWSVTSVFDKMCVTRSSPAFYVVAFHLLYTAVAFPVLRLLRRPILPTARREWPLLSLVAATHVGTLLTQMLALELTLVSYVIAIKRAGMILSVGIGVLVFGEHHPGRRLVGAAIMTMGVILILLG